MLNNNVSNKDNASTSFAQHRQRLFKYKLFSNELPTLALMKQYRSDLYQSDEYLYCQRHKETQAHLWMCPSHHAQ